MKVIDLHCCECDYCAASPCDYTPIAALFLTDYPQTHNYYLFCAAHKAYARAIILTYLARHPGVAIADDGAWDAELAAYFYPAGSV